MHINQKYYEFDMQISQNWLACHLAKFVDSLCGEIKRWPSDKLIIFVRFVAVAHQIHSSSNLYLEKSGYPLNCLVCICTQFFKLIYELIWLSNCNTLHIFVVYIYTYCFWFTLPFHFRYIVNLGHTHITPFSCCFFLGHPTFCT